MIKIRDSIEGWTGYLLWLRNLARCAPPGFTYVEVGAVKGQSVLALADSLDEYRRKRTLWAVAPSDAQTAEGDLETEVNLRLTSQETHIETAGALEAGDRASLISSK